MISAWTTWAKNRGWHYRVLQHGVAEPKFWKIFLGCSRGMVVPEARRGRADSLPWCASQFGFFCGIFGLYFD